MVADPMTGFCLHRTPPRWTEALSTGAESAIFPKGMGAIRPVSPPGHTLDGEITIQSGQGYQP